MSSLRRFLEGLCRPELGRTTTVAKRSQVPTPLPQGRLFVVGNPAQWAVFACPCGTGHDVMVRIDDTGTWRLTNSRWRRRPTLWPSVVAMVKGRRCHYWVTDGRVRWIRSS